MWSDSPIIALFQTKADGGGLLHCLRMAASSSFNSSTALWRAIPQKALKSPSELHIRQRNFYSVASLRLLNVPSKITGGIPLASSTGKGVPLMAMFRIMGRLLSCSTCEAVHTPIDQATTCIWVYAESDVLSKSRER